MHQRSLLIASTALATFAASGYAQAKSDFYVSVLGGANWVQGVSAFRSSERETASFSESPDGGFLIGGAVGVQLDKWLTGLRAEVETSYRRNRLNGDWKTSRCTEGCFGEHGPFAGHTSTFSLMANVWYEFDVGLKFRPYVGGGAGWARRELTFIATDTDDLGMNTRDNHIAQENGFAYQLGFGGEYEISRGVDLGIGYRYFRAPDIKRTVLPDGGELFVAHLPVDFRGDNHSVALSLTIHIDD